MQRLAAVAVGLTIVTVADLEARDHYFHSATLLSIEQQRDAAQIYVIDSPLGIFSVRYNRTALRSYPRLSLGPIRISIEPQAIPGDKAYLLDTSGKEYRTTILMQKAHPPPPPVF